MRDINEETVVMLFRLHVPAGELTVHQENGHLVCRYEGVISREQAAALAQGCEVTVSGRPAADFFLNDAALPDYLEVGWNDRPLL